MKWLFKFLTGSAFTYNLGGGGGGSAPAPTTQTVQQSNIPEYARPYFEDIMNRGTTVSNTQYQPYQGQRVADFTPMQQQGFQGIQNLGVSPLLQPAAGMTGAAGLGGLFAGQNYAQQATSPGSMQAYMSPYMQNVVDFQKSQAIQDYGRQLPGQQAAASRAGAFGGSRQAIVESEAQRNLQNTLGGIQAQGSQQAFEQANKNLQFGSQLGLQGLGLAGQMGQQFGQLGQTAFGQEAASAQAQQQAGAAQQAQQQDILNKRYEDFMQQTLYPQSQLQFLSSLLRGSVVSPQQTMYQYQAPPSAFNQLATAGLGAYGVGKLFGSKKGGEVKSYAQGGDVNGYAAGGGVGNPQAQYALALRMPPERLQQIASGMPGPIEQGIALTVLRQKQQTQTAFEGEQAKEMLGQPTVKDQILGLAALPASDISIPEGGITGEEDAEEIPAAAEGGAIRFQDRGDVPARFGSLSRKQYEESQPDIVPKSLKELYNYSPRLAQAKAREAAIKDAALESGFTRDPITGLLVPLSDMPPTAYLDKYSDAPSTGILDLPTKAASSRTTSKAKAAPKDSGIAVGQFAQEPDAAGSGPSSIYPTATGAQAAPLSEDEMIRQYAEKAAGYMKEPREAFRAAQKAATAEQEKELAGMGDTSKGLAALRAAVELSKPGRQSIESLGAAFGAAGETGAQYDKEKRAVLKEQRASGLEAAKAEMAFKQGDYALGAQLMDKSEDRRLKAAELAGMNARHKAALEMEGKKLSETERKNNLDYAYHMAYVGALQNRGGLQDERLDNANKQQALAKAIEATKTQAQIFALKKMPEYKDMSPEQIQIALANKYYKMLKNDAGLGAPAPAAPGANLDLSKWGQSQQVGS